MLRTSPPVSARPLLGALVAFSLLTAAGGWALFRSQRDRLVRLQLEQLTTVAEVQARLVVNWRRERLGDVRTLLAGLGHASLEAIELDGAERHHAIEHLQAICRHYGYRRAQLFDATGRLLLAVDGNGVARPEPLPGDLLQSVAAAPGGALVAAAPGHDRPRFVVLGRGGGRGSAVIAALTVDAEAALFPTLSPWPVGSSTGASFLAEPSGEGFRAILPRPRSESRRSLSPEPGAEAREAPAGARALPMRAEDGRAVYAALRPIEEAGWWLAARVDRDELGQAVLAVALRAGVGCALLISTVWASALVLWNRARLRTARVEQERAGELRALVDHAPDAIVLIDADGRILEANRAMCGFLGLPREELLGREAASFATAESLARQPIRLAEVLAGERVVLERTLRSADGREAPWEISAGRLPDGRLIAFGRDVTERHALEHRMRLLSRALEESPSPALIADPTGAIEYVNRSYTEVTGHARVELLGTRPRFLEPDGGGGDSTAGILREAKAGREWSGERVDRRKDGDIFFWSLRVHPIADETGRVEHLLVVGEDVSERRRLAERFRLAHRIVRMGVWEWDFSRRELWWSDECYELYGVERASFRPDRGILTLVHPEDRPAVERAFQRALDGGPPFELEFRIQPGGQGERRVRSVAALLRDEAGLPLAAIGVVLDVSERHAAERALEETREQLHHAQKMEALGRLAGGVAHDFNNLLGVVLGYAELLETSLPASEGRHELREIRRAAERAAELTRQLLAIGRRQALELRAVELRAMLDEVELLLRRVLPERIELVFDVASGLDPVQADPSMLLQIVLNLALNARDAMPGGGRLELVARAAVLDADGAASAGVEPGRYARLEVTDSGEGMTPEVLERAFEPFFTTRGGQGGSGLGLATVYGIVRQLGGNVELRSAPGQGTTVTLLLPAAAATTPAPAAAAELPARARAPRVLVVEDVAPLGEMIERMLDAGGHEVSVVETPEAALDLAARPGFELDLLLTDLVLPGMDGRELARRLRALLPGLKVVVMSGYSDLLAEATGPGDLGADAVLPKPFTRGRLEEVLAAVLAGSDTPEAAR